MGTKVIQSYTAHYQVAGKGGAKIPRGGLRPQILFFLWLQGLQRLSLMEGEFTVSWAHVVKNSPKGGKDAKKYKIFI